MSKAIEPMISAALIRPDIFCAVTWREPEIEFQSAAQSYAEYAADYAVDLASGQVFAAFRKTHRDATLCSLVLRELKDTSNYRLFLSGTPEVITWRLLNVVKCYANALSCPDQKAYCRVESTSESKPYRGAMLDPLTLKSRPNSSAGTEIHFVCPCRDLAPFLMLSKKTEAELVDQVQAAAIDKKQALCPLFDIRGFQEILPEPAKYW